VQISAQWCREPAAKARGGFRSCARADLAQETAQALSGRRGVPARNDQRNQKYGFIGGQLAGVDSIRNADVALSLIKDYREKVLECGPRGQRIVFDPPQLNSGQHLDRLSGDKPGSD
jgi:hypothetical protein